MIENQIGNNEILKPKNDVVFQTLFTRGKTNY